MPRFFSFCFLFISASYMTAAEPVRIERDIVYANDDGGKRLLDLARPASTGPHPAVVCFHGGAWKFGNKNYLSRTSSYLDVDFGSGKKSLIEWLASEGYVAISVGYRLAPKFKFPAPIEDAKTAVRFLRANAQKYGIDPNRIAALGYSAGGHLAALLGTTDSSDGFDGPLYPDQSSRVQCVVDFFGPTDLTLYAESAGIEKAYMAPFLGTRFTVKPDVFKKASPIEYVSKDDPPFLILHGTADLIVPIIHSERFDKKLRNAGVSSELKTVSGEGHGWTGDTALKTMTTVAEFLDAHMKEKR